MGHSGHYFSSVIFPQRSHHSFESREQLCLWRLEKAPTAQLIKHPWCCVYVFSLIHKQPWVLLSAIYRWGHWRWRCLPKAPKWEVTDVGFCRRVIWLGVFPQRTGRLHAKLNTGTGEYLVILLWTSESQGTWGRKSLVASSLGVCSSMVRGLGPGDCHNLRTQPHGLYSFWLK